MSNIREVKMLDEGHDSWEKFRKERGAKRDEWFAALPPKPTFVKEEFKEDQVVVMPLLEEGVVALGDLFDITTGKNVGSSLIHYNSLTTDHLVAHPRKDLEYRFDYISDHIDLLDTLNVTAEIQIDIVAGTFTIGITGKGLYDSHKTRKFYEDEIKCTYRNETFSLVLLPTAFYGEKAIINDDVYKKLIEGSVKATHICTELILGGETIANLYFKTDDNIDKMLIKGSLEISVKMGDVDKAKANQAANAQSGSNSNGPNNGAANGSGEGSAFDIKGNATMEMQRNATLNHIDQRIYVYSKPPFETQPSTVDEMLMLIKNLPANVAKEKHYKMFNGPDYPDVTGVPLRFKLTPIGQLVDTPTTFRKTYRVVTTGTVNQFLRMLAVLRDFQSTEFIKRKIYQRDSRLITMLLDQDNPVTIKITQRETYLAEEAKEIQVDADAVWRRYKEQPQPEVPIEEEDLLAVLRAYNERFRVLEIYQEIEDFRRECKKEIVGIHLSDADDDVVVTFLSNEMDMEDFYGSERRTKILLHTNTENDISPVGTFLRLYNLSAHLKRLGADVGVAYPSISSGFKLMIKTNAVESIYTGEDIPFALEILGLAVGKAEKIPKLFWTVNGALTGIRLPLTDNISDIPSLITVNKELQDVQVCPTYLTLREVISKQDGRVKIVLEVAALESVADSIVFFRRLRSELQKEPAFVPVDWAVGTFDMGKSHDAPVAFAFLDGELFSVCLDNLDVLLLLEQLRSSTPDFDMLKAERLRQQCMYPNRGTYGMQVAELLGQYQGSMTDNVEELQSFARPEPEPVEGDQQLFEYLQQNNLEDAITVNREMVSGNPLNVISAIAVICMRSFPQLLASLKTMQWNEAAGAFNVGLRASHWMEVSIFLIKFLENVHPLLAKADYLRKKLESILESYGESEQPIDMDVTIKNSVKLIKEDPLCPLELKTELEGYNNANQELKWKGYQQSLSKYVEKEYSKTEYFNLRHFINFLAVLIGAQGDTSNPIFDKFVPDTVGLYINQVLGDEKLELFAGVEKKLREHLDNKNFYQTLSLLSKTKYDHMLFMVHQHLYLLSDFKDAEGIKKIVGKMGKEEFKTDHYEDLWKNKKFQHYMMQGVSSQSVLEGLATYQCPIIKGVATVPDFMPVEFQEKLIPMLVVEDDLKFEWAQSWDSLDDLLPVLKSIIVRRSIPKLFSRKMQENMEEKTTLRESLESIGALFHWDDERKLFTQPWDLFTITKVVDKIMAFQDTENLRTMKKFEIAMEKPVIEEPQDESEQKNNQLIVNESWKSIANDLSEKPTLRDYHTLSKIISSPVIKYADLNKAMERILPFVTQRAKFLSNNPLKPKTVRNYIRYPVPKDFNRPGVINFGDKKPEDDKIPLVSRGDILTYLFNSTDPHVAKNVIQLLANSPNYALPMVIQNMSETIGGGQNHILLYPQLKNIPVRWEVRPDEVVENHLFSNPFRLTVVVRLGDNKTGLGKSSILNTVMSSTSREMFSSIADKDSISNLDRPISHPGLVELTYLTKETCKDTLWRKLLESYYLKFNSAGENDVLLLANLHGDALEHPRIVEELKDLGAQFLAFVMPENWDSMKEKMINFTNFLGGDQDVLFAIIDPVVPIESGYFAANSVITSGDIESKNTAVLEGLLLESFDGISIPHLNTKEHTILTVQDSSAPEATRLIDIIKRLSCKTVRQYINSVISSWNNNQPQDEDWSDNPEVRELLEAIFGVVRLTTGRDAALSHVQQELCILSTVSSMKPRRECLQLIDELKESVEAETPIVDEIRNLHNQIMALRIWIDERTLGLEHFFRKDLGALCDSPVSPIYADHILNGNEIEIFNRGAGNIFWGDMLKYTLTQYMPEGFERSRVFVVSIVGLISSGKSTLLNALFGSKFSVSIGGGTQGIFMKLLFLEEKLRVELKVDVIILLDTQGISTIGNVGDEETLQAEQQLVSLAIGLSNLTLLNSQGRKLGNMSNVLESVFAKLTTVEKLSFIPDFLLVHHHTGHRVVQSEIAILELTTALRNVSDLTEKKELEMGVRERMGRRLNKIMRRVKHRDISHNISNMYAKKSGEGSGISNAYHNDVVRLYEEILVACKESDKIMTFGDWYEFSEKLWQDLTCHKDNFPLRFTNSEKIDEYLQLQTKISEVKELIDLAFHSHDAWLKSEIAEIEIEPGLLETDEEEDEGLTWRDKKRIFQLNMINTALRKMAGTCERPLEGEAGANGETGPCQPCLFALQEKEALITALKGSNYRFETQEKLNDYIVQVRLSIWNRLTQALTAFEIRTTDHEKSNPTLNKEFNEALEKLEKPERPTKIPQFVAPMTTVIPAHTQIVNEVSEHYKNLPGLISRIENEDKINLGSVKAFDLGYYNAIKVFELELPEEEEEEVIVEENEEGGEDEIDFGCDADKEKAVYLNWAQQDWIESQIKDIPELMWQGRNYAGAYKVGLVRDFQARLAKILVEFEQRTREKLLPMFKWEAHLFGILYFMNYMKEKQVEWDLENQPLQQIDDYVVVPPPAP